MMNKNILLKTVKKLKIIPLYTYVVQYIIVIIIIYTMVYIPTCMYFKKKS